MNPPLRKTISKCIRAITYASLVTLIRLGGGFTESMETLIREVEYEAEMKRRGTVLKRRQY